MSAEYHINNVAKAVRSVITRFPTSLINQFFNEVCFPERLKTLLLLLLKAQG